MDTCAQSVTALHVQRGDALRACIHIYICTLSLTGFLNFQLLSRSKVGRGLVPEPLGEGPAKCGRIAGCEVTGVEARAECLAHQAEPPPADTPSAPGPRRDG